jgi:CheY-like chemotaxis protein
MKLNEASILMVDDERMLLELLASWLSRWVGKVFLAQDGEEALRILSAHTIDLIISDIRMPRMDGVALMSKINEAQGPMPPVIFTTGYSDVTLRQAQDLGAQAIIEKPIARDTLMNEMRRSLTEPDELWQESLAGMVPHTTLATSFESLDAALQEKRIAFGRRGFCIKEEGSLQEGPINFQFDFTSDQRVVSGRGIVRWVAPQDMQAGVEITNLDAQSRRWMIRMTEQKHPRSFIPASTGLHPSSRTNVA